MNLTTDISSSTAPRGGRVDGSPAGRLWGRFMDVIDEYLKEEGAK
jgi:hypothetical protein